MAAGFGGRWRWVAYGFGLGLVVLVVSPVGGDPPRDSFPLSTYPMFSRPRGRPVVDRIEAVGPAGRRVVPPSLVATGEVMQAAVTARRAVRRGGPVLRQLCEHVARRLARRPEFADARAVEVVSVRFDPVPYFTHGPEPVERRVRTRCRVPR